MVVSWKERFMPEGGGSPVYTDRCWQAEGGETETDVYEVLEPATDGLIEIINLATDCSPDATC